MINFVTNEIQHRMMQASYLGIIPKPLQVIVESRGAYKGNIKIEPVVNLKDTWTIFSNPTPDALSHWILKGEQSTWPVLAAIKTRLMVEQALEESIKQNIQNLFFTFLK